MHFPHHSYTAPASTAHFTLLRAEPGPAPGTAEYARRMRVVGDAWHAAGVGAVYLVHGTFVGDDTAGMVTELGRFFPRVANHLRGLTKSTIDQVIGDKGNFTGEASLHLQRALNPPGAPRLPVRRFNWTGENNHIGRADGAVRLVEELASLDLAPGKRILLVGHSHGGNVLAIVTHLLAGKPEAIEQFFDAARPYYVSPLTGRVDHGIWPRVRTLLAERRFPADRPLDIVTLGAPIRYGWNTSGCAKLLHLIYHRPQRDLPAWRVPFRVTLLPALDARHGDYIQQIGLAGTNFAPSVLAWRAFWADLRLRRFLQRDTACENLYRRLKAGVRVADWGSTLLVDYGPTGRNIMDHLAGHSVYTRRHWLLFHAEEVTRHLYSPCGARDV